MMDRLELTRIGQIRDAEIDFGDLTVMIGPQATGKSIALQMLRLAVDAGFVQYELRRHGIDWQKQLPEFLDVYFGGGMRSLVSSSESHVAWQGQLLDLDGIANRQRKTKIETLFFIPAQRVLALRDGWPRPFSDYSVDDPFAVRQFSEQLRLMLDHEFKKQESLFPQPRRLKREFRDLLGQSIFSEFSLRVDRSQRQKRLVLGAGKRPALPYMVWSAGQREFVPLLLGLYWLIPPTKVSKRKNIEWVVIEELEMGLHPKAISVIVLLLFELLSRGYRVCISTHSPQVLEAVWALRILKESNADPRALLDIFEAKKTAAMIDLAKKTLTKNSKVYYFGRNGSVRDISNLEPGSEDAEGDGWGGLVEFSARANAAVARAAANADREAIAS